MPALFAVIVGIAVICTGSAAEVNNNTLDNTMKAYHLQRGTSDFANLNK